MVRYGAGGKAPTHGPRLTGTCVKPGNPAATAEPARTDKLTFQAPERWVTPGDTFQVPVYMLNGRGVVALNLKVHYDPQVIQPVPPAVAGNLMTGARAEVNVQPRNEPGVAYLGFFDKDGLPAPAGTLGVLKFRPVGQTGDRTPLRVEVTTLNRGDESKPAYETIDCAVYVLGRSTPGTTPGTAPPIPSPGSGSGPGGRGVGTAGDRAGVSHPRRPRRRPRRRSGMPSTP